jgi:hypothetical protein
MTLKANDTLLNGQYRIIRQLGRGGFGFVYLASDTLLGEQVAIKEMIPSLVGDESILKRFLAEAKATMRLTHERIVRTHNVFSERGNYYIAMEFMAGGSLEERLKRGSLRPENAVQVAVEVCEGLTYAHERGVVHCDLKPANILFSADDQAKVADFGIAHVSEQLLTRTWQTPTTFVAGTLPYMSPEQADGMRDDFRIDIYALGAVLYRMLTGRTYLDFDDRDTPGAQANNVQLLRTQPVAPPSGINRRTPAWLDAVVLKSLAKQPENRYASAAAFRSALVREGAAAQAAPVEKAAAKPPSRVAPRRRTAGTGLRAALPSWFWIVAGAAAALLVVLVIVIAIALGGGGEPDSPFVTVVVLPPDAPSPAATVDPVLAVPSATGETPMVVPTPSYFEDGFTGSLSGWDEYEDETTKAGYAGGEFQLAVDKDYFAAWANPNPGVDWADLEIAVDARAVGGPVNNSFGLIVRYQPGSDDYYWYKISSDGYYAVDIYENDDFASLVKWTKSEAINQDLDATNRLKVVCSGEQCSFYVNDSHLTDVSDGRLRSGNIGLGVATLEEPGVVVHFDNVAARALTK